MTDPWIDSCRGGVAAWEVDHVGHFTVAYYHQRIEDAGFAALEALGLGPAYARSEGRDCLTTDCYVRYLHELRGGDIYHVRSGVLAIEEEALVFGHRLFDAEGRPLGRLSPYWLTLRHLLFFPLPERLEPRSPKMVS